MDEPLHDNYFSQETKQQRHLDNKTQENPRNLCEIIKKI
jgi:hypothetical protein